MTELNKMTIGYLSNMKEVKADYIIGETKDNRKSHEFFKLDFFYESSYHNENGITEGDVVVITEDHKSKVLIRTLDEFAKRRK